MSPATPECYQSMFLIITNFRQYFYFLEKKNSSSPLTPVFVAQVGVGMFLPPTLSVTPAFSPSVSFSSTVSLVHIFKLMLTKDMKLTRSSEEMSYTDTRLLPSHK